MKKSIKNFFISLEEPNFLAMKLLLGLFTKFEYDELSRRIVDNIFVLSQYNIRLLYDEGKSNYVYSADDLSRIEYGIIKCGSYENSCHEFGHLLLDIFARGEVPDDFFEVNAICKKRLIENKKFVSHLLKHYCDEVFKKITMDVDNPLSFYNRYPELRCEYFKRYPDNNEDDLIQDILIDHFNLISAFDINIDNYNRVSNIIDAMFCGDNPFWLDYGNEDVDPVLSMHHDDYFMSSNFGPLVMGFEEQFADYLVLRTFHEKTGEARIILKKLIGEEWFIMMDNFYDKVTSRIVDRGNVYIYK